MQCSLCLLRYNLDERVPLIIHCGHSYCKMCLPKCKNCPGCGQTIVNEPKINHSLHEILQKDHRVVDKFIKVCFIGSSGVGKTSLIRMLTGEDFSRQVSSTIGYDFTFVDRKIDKYNVRYQLWDSAGQQRYRAISPIHYKNANIIVIVYNVQNNSQNNDILKWLSQCEKNSPENALKVIIGNKVDLVDGKVCQPLQKQVQQIIQNNNILKHQTSCKMGIGLQGFWNILQDYFVNRNNNKNNEAKDSQRYVKSIQTNNVKIKAKKNKMREAGKIKVESNRSNSGCC